MRCCGIWRSCRRRPLIASTDGVATILRAPVAYYVLPGLLGRLAGAIYGDGFLYLWTFAGTLLFLLQVMAGESVGVPSP